MVEIQAKTPDELETSLGKQVIDNIETIEKATAEVLKNNLDLRRTEHRSMVRMLVENKLGKRVAEGSVDRACRTIQNTEGLWKPEPEDNREELQEIHHGYYAGKKNG